MTATRAAFVECMYSSSINRFYQRYAALHVVLPETAIARNVTHSAASVVETTPLVKLKSFAEVKRRQDRIHLAWHTSAVSYV